MLNKITYHILRLFRRIYWLLNFRNDILSQDLYKIKPALEYTKIVKSNLTKNINTVLEIGCFNGRDLIDFSSTFPNISFYGVDLQKEAIYHAKKRESKCLFFSADIISTQVLNLVSKCDLILSCATLIYLDEKEIIIFFENVKKDIIFCEITSLTKKTIKKHIYIHPYAEIIKKIMPDYDHKMIFFDYESWMEKSDKNNSGVVGQEVNLDYMGCIHIVKKN